MGTENAEIMDPSGHPWASDVRRMFDAPDVLVSELPAVADVVRGYLAPGISVRQRHLESLLVAALAHGEETEPRPSTQDERRAARNRMSLREGARGTFFLRVELDAHDTDGQPGPEDEMLVYGPDGRKDTITEHRRWAGLRFGRADGRRGNMTPSTVAKWGTFYRSEFEARLVDDLETFLADEQAQRAFVDAVIPLNEQSEHYREPDSPPTPGADPHSARPTHRLLLDQLASRLDEPSAAYPRHLTPTALAHQLTLSPYARPERAEQEDSGLYASTSSFGGRSLRYVLSENRRIVVVGNPGGGKSTVLAAEVAERTRAGEPALMVRLSSVAPRLEGFLSFAGALGALVSVALEDGGLRADPDDTERLLKTMAKEPSALVALDGLDEVHPDDLDRVWTLCRVLEALPGTVVISSRVAGYVAPPGEWTEYSVDNLSSGQASSFLESWFRGVNKEGKERADAALAAADRAELAQIPVLLGIIASVAEDDEVPGTEAALYDRYVSLFLRGRWKPRAQWLKVEHLPRRLAVARELAWQMATGFTGRADGVRWSDTISYSAVIDKATTPRPRLARLIVERDGLFTPHGRSASELHQRYRWLHRTIHEHLVGAYFADRVTADRGALAIEDEILMGPKQWHVPLLHMIGLLSEADQARVMARLDELRDEGDPGLVLDGTAELLAAALPVGADLRRREAERRAARGDWRAVYALDQHLWLRRLPELVAAGAEDVGLPFDLFAKQDLPPESYVRDLLARQLSAPEQNQELLATTIRWLVSYDADGALDALLVASRNPRFSPEFDWDGTHPSPTAVSRAVEEIATWSRIDRRFTYLHRIVTAGTNLEDHVTPLGPLNLEEVRTVTAVARRHVSSGDSTQLLPHDVHRALLSGEFGNELAEASARWDGAERIDRAQWAPAALLVDELSELREVTVAWPPDEGAALEARRLDHLFDDDASDPDQWRLIASAATACVRGAGALSTDWCLQTYWNLHSIYCRLQDAGRTRLTGLFHDILGAVERAFVARPADARVAVLNSSLSDWIADSRPTAAFDAVRALYDTGVFSVDDVIWLIRWAAEDKYVMLNTIDGDRLGLRVAEVAERLWLEAPETLEISEYALGRSLAQFGQLVPWRDRLIRAGQDFEAKQKNVETAQ